MSTREAAPEDTELPRREREDDEYDTAEDELKLAGFYVGHGLYGIDIMRIKEVIQSRPYPVRPVPHAPSIVEGVISCKIALDPPPDYPEEVEVSIAGVVYPQLPSAASCGDGWYYTTPAKDELELCGAACDQLKVTFQADIAYKCPQN